METEELQTVAELVVSADAEMLSLCRMVLVAVGAGLPLSDEALDDLKLVLSEACASAIENTVEAGGRLLVGFRTSSSEIEVSVSDRSQSVDAALKRHAFGISLLRQLCTRVEVLPQVEGPGTVVRFAQTLPA